MSWPPSPLASLVLYDQVASLFDRVVCPRARPRYSSATPVPSSGSIARNQAERGHRLILVLVMARVRTYGESSFLNYVIIHQCPPPTIRGVGAFADWGRNNLHACKDCEPKNGPSQGQNLALGGVLCCESFGVGWKNPRLISPNVFNNWLGKVSPPPPNVNLIS